MWGFNVGQNLKTKRSWGFNVAYFVHASLFINFVLSFASFSKTYESRAMRLHLKGHSVYMHCFSYFPTLLPEAELSATTTTATNDLPFQSRKFTYLVGSGSIRPTIN